MKELQDKKENIFFHMLKSTKYSIEGLISATKEERSLHLFSVVVIFLIVVGIYLKISLEDTVLIVFIMSSILVVELLNTAIENVVDLVSKEKNPYAKKAKDCGSAATFILVVIGIIIGIKIFIPYMK